jgi:hypothetical protein
VNNEKWKTEKNEGGGERGTARNNEKPLGLSCWIKPEEGLSDSFQGKIL